MSKSFNAIYRYTYTISIYDWAIKIPNSNLPKNIRNFKLKNTVYFFFAT